MKRAVFALLLGACTHAVPLPVVIEPQLEPVPTTAHVTAFSADTVFHEWFADVHARHPDVETATCVYGVVNAAGQAVALFTRPAPVDSATETSVSFKTECFRPNPKYFGALRYLGIAHNHPNNMCALSEPDARSFRLDVDAVVEIVICDKGLVVSGRSQAPAGRDW
jgi:hypothetical protein